MPAPGLAAYLLDDAPARWASRLIRGSNPAGAVLPLYGSSDWERAPDAIKLASALRAAEVHRREPLFDIARLDAELRRQWQIWDQAQWEQIAEQVRFLASPKCPTHAQLVERRAEVTRPAGYQPRPWPVSA